MSHVKLVKRHNVATMTHNAAESGIFGEFMFIEIGYDRAAAVEYARRWAYDRNQKYMDFEHMGGDCTNFASQCVYAGCNVMNYTPTLGWYYINASNRTPSWTGVPYFYSFLVTNKEQGPYARQTAKEFIEIGDIVQLGNADGEFYHSPVVCSVHDGEIFVAAHTFDTYMRPLSSYLYQNIRYLNILGAREKV